MLRLGIAGTSGVRDFYVMRTHGGSSFYIAEHPDFQLLVDAGRILRVEKVECTTLKGIFEDNGLERCDFLKMDCEEAEREIFSPESRPYFKRVNSIALEWHNYDGHKYAGYLRRLGFSVLLTGCGVPPPPYSRTFGRGMLYAKPR